MTTKSKMEEGQIGFSCPTNESIRGESEKSNSPREDCFNDIIHISSRSTDETEKSGCKDEEEILATEKARIGKSYPKNDYSAEEGKIVFINESEDSERDPNADEFFFLMGDSEDRRIHYHLNKAKLKKVIQEGGDESALYPQDCYSLISLHGPKTGFFWFGLMVFSVQMSFLLLMILSVVNPNWKVGIIDDNPWEGNIADYIATESSPLLRGAQFMSLLTFVVFADASMLDIITAVHTFPNFAVVTNKDKIGCMLASCFLRFIQGAFASIVAVILVFTSSTVIEVILNFTALNFISALDNVAFEFAKDGKYGGNLEQEVKRIKELPLPVCMYRKHKSIRFWYTIIPAGAIVLVGFFYVVWCQEHSKRWETWKFRIEFGEDPMLQDFSGCYQNDFNSENDIFKRDLYVSDSHNERPASFGFCIRTHQWYLYRGNHPDPCDAEIIVHSTTTDSFDIATVFLEDWFTASHTPAELYFFDDDYQGNNLHCEQFLNNGICDKDFNKPSYHYDNGDCCAATCTVPNCEIGGLLDAFGSTNTSGDGYSNCKDPEMTALTITLNGFISSHDPEVLVLSEENLLYIDNSMPDYYHNTPSDTLLSLYCNQVKILKYYVNEFMENQSQTVEVSDGASCEIRIENTTSSKPKWGDAPIWYMNYTVRYGDNYNNAISLAQGYSKDNGIALFDLMPKCYLEIFEEHISTDMIDHDDNIQGKAAHWMMERESSDTDCLNLESSLSRFALAVLNFAAPISPSINSGLESRLWIEKDSPGLCNWESIVCAKNSNATQMDLIHLDLSGLGISGYLPTELGLLSTLARYDVSHNTLTGLIPSEIGELTTLSVLKLNYNNLTGSIPKEIGLLTSINEIFIESNHWTGSIPIEIGFLSDLVDLNVGNNTLNGNIPSEIGLMTSLTFLNVDTNDLTGTIPSEIGLLTNLVILNLNNNGLTGPIPSEIGLLTALERLRIGNNFLTGFIPSEIRSLTSLTKLDIDSISSEMEGLSALEELPFIVDFP